MIRLKFEGKLTVLLLKDENEKNIVAYSPALDLSSCGNTPAEARKNFTEALQIYLKETIEHGTLQKDLIDLGWQVNSLNLTMRPPTAKSHKNIPLHLLKKIQIQLPSSYR